MRNARFVLLGSAVLALATILLAAASPDGPDGSAEPAPPPTGRPGFANHDPGVRYVGREDCRLCHMGIYNTFGDTGMGRSFSRMSPDNTVGERFEAGNALIAPGGGVRYEMLERDGRFYQVQYLLDSKGRRTALDERELVYEVGSNNHGRGYITEQDGGLFQMPVCWDPTTSRWILCPGFETGNSHFSREISLSCIFCHNGRMELVPGERNRYREPLPHGVGCERCHGPGELHVAKYLGDDEAATEDSRPTIVNPGKLAGDRRIQVCFQCHLGDSSATERVVRYGRALTDFRPGQPLIETVVPFRYVEPTRFDFGMAAQADRLILSRCYTESDGRLECLTCHNPHVTIYSPQRPADYFRRRCLTCHTEEACEAPAEQRQLTADDDCVACHMRRAVAVDRKHAQFTDHWIRRDARQERRDRRTDFELEPVFPEEFATLPAGEQAYYLGRAYFIRARAVPRSVRLRMWARAERQFGEAIEKGFDVDDVWFFLGKTYMYTKRWRDAAVAFDEALSRDPEHHDAAFALGQTMAELGEYQAARTIFAGMLERDPQDAMALAEYGRCLWTLKEPEGAIEAYRRAVSAEPWSAELHLALGKALASAGRFAEAAASGFEAARLDPDSLKIWSFCANAWRAAGNTEQAQEASWQVERLKDGGRTPAE